MVTYDKYLNVSLFLVGMEEPRLSLFEASKTFADSQGFTYQNRFAPEIMREAATGVAREYFKLGWMLDWYEAGVQHASGLDLDPKSFDADPHKLTYQLKRIRANQGELPQNGGLGGVLTGLENKDTARLLGKELLGYSVENNDLRLAASKAGVLTYGDGVLHGFIARSDVQGDDTQRQFEFAQGVDSVRNYLRGSLGRLADNLYKDGQTVIKSPLLRTPITFRPV